MSHLYRVTVEAPSAEFSCCLWSLIIRLNHSLQLNGKEITGPNKVPIWHNIRGIWADPELPIIQSRWKDIFRSLY
ncbi:hypothetical protein XELAEV_18024111mg [Xenopus laevis]|uniref:Uncharacterized protein n=1 Tax=Xenopus laevis TaxID=8355 RepID=A0A974D677_XENLA|nr:hypothetical protein XELAEV_18024111mg [Xenopus laevis]